MNVDLLYNLLIVAKNEVETRSDKVDPCTGPTYVSLTIADWQVALVELHISTGKKKIPGKKCHFISHDLACPYRAAFFFDYHNPSLDFPQCVQRPPEAGC